MVVYDASSGGVGAAVAAARSGKSVLLIEPTGRVGGMLTNGVTSDLFLANASTGVFDEYRALVLADYQARGLGKHPLIRNGLFSEPEVSLRAVQKLLANPNITLVTNTTLASVTKDRQRITSVTLSDGRTFGAQVFIDASPAGDLLGLAGVEGRDFVVGREATSTYKERLAPKTADRRQQAYTYRMTVQIGGRRDYAIPATYAEDRARYRLIKEAATPKTSCTFGGKLYSGIRIQRCLPNSKMDINIDLIGLNHSYPTDVASRPATEARLRGFVIGYLHYLRTEGGYPELGLSLDDYPATQGFPEVLYVREGRRAIGQFTFTERDAIRGNVGFKPSSVAIGEYGLDSHCFGPTGGVSARNQPCEGGFWTASDPYQVPYEAMVPRHLQSLLVPVPLSASHVGYSTLRMEPVRMNLGFAAGFAASQAIDTGVQVRDIDVERLQKTLVGARQALFYTAALDHRAPGFATRQTSIMGVLSRFRDVPATSTHIDAVHAMTRMGVLQGYGDDSFRPSVGVTRGNFATMLMRLLDLPPATSTDSFTDIVGHRDAGAIETLARHGIIQGHADNTFRPNELVRRDQMASLIVRWRGLAPRANGPFVDLGAVHAGNVNALYHAGIVKGTTPTRFTPAQTTRRDQVATLLNRARDPKLAGTS